MNYIPRLTKQLGFVAVAYLASCSLPQRTLPESPIAQKSRATIKEAQEVLKIKHPAFIATLPQGYKTDDRLVSQIKWCAGVHSGDIKARRIGSLTYSQGSYQEFSKPQSLDYVLQQIDYNQDKILSRKEVTSYYQITIKNLINSAQK